jgi:hypothetical protein
MDALKHATDMCRQLAARAYGAERGTSFRRGPGCQGGIVGARGAGIRIDTRLTLLEPVDEEE